jgi:Uma2 family endonuclease
MKEGRSSWRRSRWCILRIKEKSGFCFVLSGKVLAECAIKTAKGTKVADVAWASEERFAKIRNEVECSIAPEVCVEVLSLSNTNDEITEKGKLYFDQGAQEVWICHGDGDIHLYDAEGRREQSVLFPHFPRHIDM